MIDDEERVVSAGLDERFGWCNRSTIQLIISLADNRNRIGTTDGGTHERITHATTNLTGRGFLCFGRDIRARFLIAEWNGPQMSGPHGS